MTAGGRLRERSVAIQCLFMKLLVGVLDALLAGAVGCAECVVGWFAALRSQ